MPKPDRLGALLAIGALLAPKSKPLIAAVTQAFTDPAKYIAAHAPVMNERGIDAPTPKLPWIALIDALAAAGALFEIDWKSDAETVEHAIGKLAKGFALPPGDEERSTWELLEQAGATLREQQLQLAQLDYGSDSYALVVVPAAKLAELARLAKQAKYGTAEAFGDDLAVATKERAARMKELARERAKPAPKQRAWRWFATGRQLWTIQVGPKWISLGYEKPGVKQHVHHVFATPKPCAALAMQLVAEWKRDGYVELSKAEQDAWPPQGDGAYLGVVLPFPDEPARYFRGSTALVCLYVRGDAFVETGGTIGKSFGELETWTHGPDPDAALSNAIAEHELWKPIDRAKAIALYAKKKQPSGSTRRGAARARATAGGRSRRARPGRRR